MPQVIQHWWGDEWWLKKWKWFEGRRSCPNRGTLPAFAWGNWETSRRTSARISFAAIELLAVPLCTAHYRRLCCGTKDGYQGSCLWLKDRDMILTTLLYFVLRSRIYGTNTAFPLQTLWCGEGQVYLVYLNVTAWLTGWTIKNTITAPHFTWRSTLKYWHFSENILNFGKLANWSL